MTARVLWHEIRRSGLPLWITPLLLLVSGLVFTRTLLRTGGQRLEWATSIFYDMTPMVVLASTLALAVAAWRAGRERRRGVAELIESTPRARSQRALLSWISVTIWPVVSCLPAVVAFGSLSREAVSGPPLFGVLTAAVSTVVAYAALGFAVGTFVPGRLTTPVAGVVSFVVMIALGSWVPHGLLSVVPQPTYGTIATNRSGVGLWDRPVWWFAPAAALWFVALTVALLVVATARRRPLAVVPSVLAVLLAIPLTQTQVWRIDTASPLLSCSDGSVRVCVPNEIGVAPNAVAASTKPVRARLADLPTVAPLGAVDSSSASAYVWPQNCRAYLERISCNSPRPSTAGEKLAERISGWQCSSSSSPGTPMYTSPAPRLERGVRDWLLGRTGDSASGIVRHLATLPDDERHEWLSRYLLAAERCDVSAVTGLRGS
ncbi:ABC-type transport system involved in multi-copper enzyme maturation, permease component [Actinopolyspora lacussalsi subsp. righensis]|uniref:ABC-type transport system involved in multi-copper enzyme maturation, permease component n=1 Tax=Actinopolyspora righensis TaxID=995060 RepID=A0A1I6Y8Y5_9ACTN|nr:ABC transporter permease [Actinopolyspora righensis]SFT46594.1 ABC-type transport system involved in multi-copper enzyme maturation, permease component [Actinopolyspora righensis]